MLARPTFGNEGQPRGGCQGRGERAAAAFEESQSVRKAIRAQKPRRLPSPDTIVVKGGPKACRQKAADKNANAEENSHNNLLSVTAAEGDGMFGFGGEPDDGRGNDEDRREQLEQIDGRDSVGLRVDHLTDILA